MGFNELFEFVSLQHRLKSSKCQQSFESSIDKYDDKFNGQSLKLPFLI